MKSQTFCAAFLWVFINCAAPTQSTGGSPPVRQQISAGPASSGLADLSQQELAQGLKEALRQGLQVAVARLGHEGGFLTNLQVRIPMPPQLQSAEKLLRSLHEDKLADDFVAAMNHAAEQAVPEAAAVFTDALRQMTVQDAAAILIGPTNAATQFFMRTTQTNLYGRFYPIVQKATQTTGVTATYKELAARLGSSKFSRTLNALGSVLGEPAFDPKSMDIDGYVTQRAMDGLFKVVAEEEGRIRKDPVARTSYLLQKVFGAVRNTLGVAPRTGP
jgi:Protein of unknown function (DUF4197)